MEGGEHEGGSQQLDNEMTSGLRPEAQDQEAPSGGSNEEGDYCRICRGEGTDELPLFYPCKCSGSIKFVHQDCLMEWLSHSQKKYCELCKTPFRFTKLYDHRMPQTLPLMVFLCQLCLHAIRKLFRWVRYLLVGFIWLGWLPWSVRQVWRGLFWLADGSWGSVMNTPAAYQQSLRNLTARADIIPALTVNNTEELISAFPQMVAPISGFLAYASSEFLLVKLVRFLYPNLFNWSAGLISGEIADGRMLFSVSSRRPSFLSDVRYLKLLTTYPIINNAIIDVLEGQLICLLIVTAFILIFLIREWVINQPPVADIPDANRVEEVRPAMGDGALGGPARRQRRRGGEEGREERIRRIAVPRPRRRLPAPVPEAENPSAAASEGVHRAHSGLNDMEALDMVSPTNHEQDEENQRQPDGYQTTEGTSSTVRPTLQARNALEDAASIRRIIEERSRHPEVVGSAGLDSFEDLWKRANGDPGEVLRTFREENCQVFSEFEDAIEQMKKSKDQEVHSLQPPLPTNFLPRQDTQSAQKQGTENEAPRDDLTFGQGLVGPVPQSFEEDEPRAAIAQTENESLASWSFVDPLQTQTGTAADSETAPAFSTLMPESAEEINASAAASDEPIQEEQASSSATDLGTSNTTSPGETDHPPHPPTTVDTLANWLWQTDAYVPEAEANVGADDEHFVEDVNQEAPFVPVPVAEAAVGGDEARAEEEQNPEVVAAAGAAGIDVNNAEAIEDAEDLDGILELIGMQGPLTGMVQNVIFSEFLITLTLAASVWLPYIWGKIALLLLSNPFGVFVKAPLHLTSKLADTVLDISLFVSGVCIYMLNSGLGFLIYLASFLHSDLPSWINTNWIGRMSLTLAAGSGTRLEKSLIRTVGGLRPDLPTFSVLSHQALRLFQTRLIMDLQNTKDLLVYFCYEIPSHLRNCLRGVADVNKYNVSDALCLITSLHRQAIDNFATVYQGLLNLGSLKPGVDAPLDTTSLDYSLVRWSTQDRIIAIVIGYAFTALVGYLYLKISRLVFGIRNGEKLEGIVADSLSQAGGVMKVILIIGIEMIVFPLYCGLLLDVALMPLFEGVGFQTRLAFLTNAPMTALFVHWFFGTCYMFHFALFVSMCRKIMRKGVLYFIRDPDDPTFHPVRDVLERPIATQLSKIAFSGLVYGGLVILCLGGIVWVVSRVEGIFPIHWTSNEPILELPIDLLFYNFLLPILIRNVEPSKKLNAMYEWWFRKCARWLRITQFLFGEQRDDEQGRHVRRTWSALFRLKQGDLNKPVIEADVPRLIPAEHEAYFVRDGTFVRAPGSDSVRIPKGGRVFLEVDDNNNRRDGEKEDENGPHGRQNNNFVKVYIPPMFRARIAAFVALIWAFAAVTGIAFTILPLTLGRKTILLITQSTEPPNDLYAFSVGLYLCGLVAYTISYYPTCKNWLLEKLEHYFKDTNQALPRIWSSMVYFSGLAYMGMMFGVILPFLFSTVVELYFVVSLHAFLTSTYVPQQPPYTFAVLPPTIHVVQTWTLGLVYLQVILRVVTHYPDPDTRAATAIRSILRQGFWHPDIRLATRAFILPSFVLSSILLVTPLCLGWTINAILQEPSSEVKINRYAYPGTLAVALALYCVVLLKRQVGVWRTRIRDDVYLIGERLHNFGEAQRRQSKGKGKARVRDGAVSERLQIQ